MPSKQDGVVTSAGLVANIILKDYHIKTLRDTEEVLYYKDGRYHFGGEQFIKEKANELYKTELNTRDCKEIIFQVQVNTYADRDSFDRDPNILNVNNGLIDIRTGKLKPHDPNYLSIVQIPVKYDPEIDCPKVRKFFKEIVPQRHQLLLAEAFGYCLYPSYPIHRAFMLIGTGANGKSKFLELLRTLLGSRNCTSVPLQMLEYDRFARASLHGKLANICTDLKSRKMSDSGTFKMLTGDDTISAEKKFRDRFEFKNHAKLLFSANNPPQFEEDDSYAFWRRWIIIEFPNTFEGSKRDTKLLEKLTTPSELSGLFNLALIGLKRVLEQGEFDYEATADQVSQTYKKVSNPVQSFLYECCDTDPEYEIPKEQLYNHYTQFCTENRLRTIDKVHFGRTIKSIYPDIAVTRHDGIYYYKGIFVIKHGGMFVLPMSKEEYDKIEA